MRQRLLLGHTAAIVAIGLGETGTLLASAQNSATGGVGGGDGSSDGGAGAGGSRSGTGGVSDAAALLLWDLYSGRRLATLAGASPGSHAVLHH